MVNVITMAWLVSQHDFLQGHFPYLHYLSTTTHLPSYRAWDNKALKLKEKTLYSHKVADVFSYMTRNFFFLNSTDIFFCVCVQALLRNKQPNKQ